MHWHFWYCAAWGIVLHSGIMCILLIFVYLSYQQGSCRNLSGCDRFKILSSAFWNPLAKGFEFMYCLLLLQLRRCFSLSFFFFFWIQEIFFLNYLNQYNFLPVKRIPLEIFIPVRFWLKMTYISASHFLKFSFVLCWLFKSVEFLI